MITVRMLFFAHLQDVAGSHELDVTLPENATAEMAAEALAGRSAGFDRLLSQARVAVNAEFADASTLLHDGDEVAWMPPMSGGRPADSADGTRDRFGGIEPGRGSVRLRGGRDVQRQCPGQRTGTRSAVFGIRSLRAAGGKAAWCG